MDSEPPDALKQPQGSQRRAEIYFCLLCPHTTVVFDNTTDLSRRECDLRVAGRGWFRIYGNWHCPDCHNKLVHVSRAHLRLLHGGKIA